MIEEVIKVNDLSISFDRYHTLLDQENIGTINKLSLTVNKGEILSIVGASGSGKSLLAHAILGILPGNSKVEGEIYFKNELINEKKMKEIRGKKIALIPQSINYLDPIVKIGKQLLLTNKDKMEELDHNMDRLGLDKSVKNMYPNELSGGMARRVLFLTAILSDADVIIADEPTPGMQVSQAIESLSILAELAKKEAKTIILITHDIDLAVDFSDRIAVFSDGQIVDLMSSQAFKEGPQDSWSHFSKQLWHSLPQHSFHDIS
ncbi:ATP-binding cassette domain-containing protein [Vagococcus jeotgali]|uniref:ATP-binding cassette domain-containing protein n=1 Tax=Vagococcus jeotgali TaxID=3109030 RepID=UPI002DDBA54F|nr:ATP-binding cassette domain-containing protein [Vagococcus sp. B2T-5]